MTQEFQKFTPDTVDEQIERISNSVPTNTENYDNISGEYVVRRLHHLYQSEQRDRALIQGWERIVQASNSKNMQDTHHLEQDSRNEGSQHPLNIHAHLTASRPDSQQQKLDHQSKGRQRIIALVQTLAAVMLVGVVLASFLAFIAYRTGTPGAKDQNPRLSTIHSIVATVALDGTVYAFQPGSKQVLWTFSKASQKRSSVASAVVVQDRVVYTIINEQMYALNAINGTVLWQQSLALPNPVQNNFEKLMSDHGILYVSGTSYVGGVGYAHTSGNIYALRMGDGKVLWHYQDATPDPLITASNKNVYVIRGDTLLVLHGDTGKVRWQKSSIVPRAIVADDTTAYVDAQLVAGKAPGNKNALFDATLLALSTQDGHVRWSTPVVNLRPDRAQTFVLYQGMIILSFFSDFPYTYHFCAYKTSNGTSVWCSSKTETPTGDGILGYTLMNATLYAGVSSQNGPSIEARNVGNGKLLWSTPSRIYSGTATPIISLNGVVYVLNGDITTFDGKSGHELWQFSKRNQSEVMIAFAVGSW